MPVSAVAVTEGSGKNLHTWQRSVSSVNREEQYVQLGESGLPTYSVSSTASVATIDSHIVQLMAPASSYVRIHRLRVEQSANATSASLLPLSILRLTTAGSGGTSATPQPFDTADTAGATAIYLNSSKGTEGVELMRTVILMRQAISATTAAIDDFWEWEKTPGAKGIIIPAGTSNGIVIKNTAAVAGGSVVVYIEFTETAWL